jgi:hypothetical protein
LRDERHARDGKAKYQRCGHDQFHHLASVNVEHHRFLNGASHSKIRWMLLLGVFLSCCELQGVVHPCIQTFVLDFCMHGHCLVQIGLNPNYKLPGVGLLRGFAALGTELKVIIHGVPESLSQLMYCCPLKCDNIPEIDDFAMENVGFVIKLDLSNISFVFHHDITSASLKNFRIELTAPLSVTRLGCGL